MKRRRHRWVWWPRSNANARRSASGTIIYTGGSDSPTLRARLFSHYRLWRAQRDWSRRLRRHDLPRFYRRAKPNDVRDLVVTGRSWTVGDFLPAGFDAYLRLPNPFWKIVAAHTENAILHGADGREGTWAKPVRCSEVAEANGRRMTRETTWSHICGPHDAHLATSPDQVWSWAPHECDLDPVTAQRLFQLLASETNPNDRCLCGQWEGGSSGWDTDVLLARDTDVLLATRHWSYFVWRARFGDVARWLQVAVLDTT